MAAVATRGSVRGFGFDEKGDGILNAAEYRALRKTIGTQGKAAEVLHVNRVTIARRECGARRITNAAGYEMSKAAERISRAKAAAEFLSLARPRLLDDDED